MHGIVRWNELSLEKALKTRRVVVVSGARQLRHRTHGVGPSDRAELDPPAITDVGTYGN